MKVQKNLKTKNTDKLTKTDLPSGQGKAIKFIAPEIIIYTDGSCDNASKERYGGYAVVLTSGKQRKEIVGGEINTTSNRMEMMAVIVGLEAIKKISNVTIYSDSKYVCNGISFWIKNWKKNGWKTGSNAKKEVKNRDLWERIDMQIARHNYVKATWTSRNTIPDQARCDLLSKEASKDIAKKDQLLSGNNN